MDLKEMIKQRKEDDERYFEREMYRVMINIRLDSLSETTSKMKSFEPYIDEAFIGVAKNYEEVHRAIGSYNKREYEIFDWMKGVIFDKAYQKAVDLQKLYEKSKKQCTEE